MHFGVRFKLTTLLLLVSVIPLLLIGVGAYSTSRLAITQVLEQNFRLTADNLIETIDRTMYERLSDTQFLIADDRLKDQSLSSEQLSAVLDEYLLNFALYHQISLTNIEGEVTASTEISMIGLDVAGQDWFQSVKREFIFASDYMISPYTDQPTVIFSNLLRDDRNQFIGVVFFELNWRVVEELLEFPGNNVSLFLFDDFSNVIASSVSGDVQRETPFIDLDSLNGRPFGRLEDYFYIETVSDGHLTYLGHRWHLLMELPSSLAFSQVRRNTVYLILLLSATVLISLLVGLISSKRAIRPILELSKGVRQISKGNLNQKIKVHEHDEIGFLAINFNKMASMLDHRNKQLQRSLEKTVEEERKYKTILENTQDAMILLDQKKRIVSLNSAASHLLNLDVFELMNKEERFLVAYLNKHSSIDIPSMQYPLNMEIVLKSPMQGCLRVMATSILDGESIQGYLWVLRDITEQKELEDKKFSFITIMSHQLRTPVTSIRWSAEGLKNSNLSDEDKEFVANIEGSALEILKTTNDLFTVSRIEEGSIKVHPEAIDLKGAFDVLMKDVAPLRQDSSRIETDWSKDLPKITFDQADIGSVLQAVLLNALRYSKPEDGPIRVSTHLNEKGFVEFHVQDRGIGVSPHDAKRIFEKFYRGKDAVLTYANGSGVGLFIVKRLMEANGGSIRFESNSKLGTIFTLVFPVKT